MVEKFAFCQIPLKSCLRVYSIIFYYYYATLLNYILLLLYFIVFACKA